ncbi:MAG: hypothetical protein Q4C29_01325 [bacterium]|nr:hypothetical protein [bacterium]
MKKSNYEVNRKDVFVGQVVKIKNLKVFDNISNYKKFLVVNKGNYEPLRTILFAKNEDKKASDLLYNCEDYPVLGISNLKDVKSNDIVITNIYNLDLLLEFYGFKKSINLDDARDIRSKFFNGRFTLNNSKLFGYKECESEISDIFVKKVYNSDISSQVIRGRTFIKCGDGYLPEIYFHAINKLGNNSLMDVILKKEENVNTFKPKKEEGYVRRLLKNDY